MNNAGKKLYPPTRSPMDSVILLMSVIAFNVLVLILSSSLDLIVARIRRSGTKVFVNNVDGSTDVRYCQVVCRLNWDFLGFASSSPSPPVQSRGRL